MSDITDLEWRLGQLRPRSAGPWSGAALPARPPRRLRAFPVAMAAALLVGLLSWLAGC